jgi:hypothetical protein
MKVTVLSALLLIPSASMVLADPIIFNSGGISAFDGSDGQTANGQLGYGLDSSNLTIISNAHGQFFIEPPNPIPTCTPSNAVGSCTWTLSYSGQVSGADLLGATVTYNGTTYTDGLGATLTLNVNVTAAPVTAPSTVTPVQNSIAMDLNSMFSGAPFTFTGTASLVYLGNAIFSNLDLAGSGVVSGSTVQEFGLPAGANGENGSLSFSFTPEPSSVALAATGFLALVIGIRRRNSIGHASQSSD